MQRRLKIHRLLVAFASMIGGTILVLGTVVLINRFAEGVDRNVAAGERQVVFNRKSPPEKQAVKKPRAKPRIRHTPRTIAPPFAGLRTDISGIDFGLPAYELSDLNGLDGDALAGVKGVVMTDDTVDDPPQATFRAPMLYPPRAKARGVKGYVVLSLLIGITGEIEQVSIIESFPAGVFDDVVLQGVSQWKFSPAMYEGKAVRAWARQRIRFDLS